MLITLPKDEYFKFGNVYTGSYTTPVNVFNYKVSYSDKYICNTWQGLLSSDCAENINTEIFDRLENVIFYLNAEISA